MDRSQQVSRSAQKDRPRDNFSEIVFQEAERYRLGVPLQRYQDREKGLSLVLLAVMGIALIIVLGLVVLLRGGDAEAIDTVVHWLIFMIPASICAWAFGYVRVQNRMQAQRRGYLCTDGFLIMEGSEQIVAAVRWSEIQEIRSKVDESNHPTATEWQVITRDNTRVTIAVQDDDIKIHEMEKLGEEVERAFKHLYPHYMTTWQKPYLITIAPPHTREQFLAR